MSVVTAPTLVQSLKDETGCPQIFSMCGDVLKMGGVLTLCGMGDHHTGDVQWTPMVDYDQGFYNIYTVDMAVGGKRLGLSSSTYNDGSTTVDSGTTLAYIPTPAMDKIKDILIANCSNNRLVGVCDVSRDETIFDGFCFALSAGQLAMYPDIQLIAGEDNPITIDFPAVSYVSQGFCSDPSAYSAAFQAGGGKGSGTLLGDPIMIANEVIYDVENQRMGFAPKSNCVYQSK